MVYLLKMYDHAQVLLSLKSMCFLSVNFYVSVHFFQIYLFSSKFLFFIELCVLRNMKENNKWTNWVWLAMKMKNNVVCLWNVTKCVATTGFNVCKQSASRAL